MEPVPPSHTVVDMLRCMAKLIDHYEVAIPQVPSLAQLKHFMKCTIEELEAETGTGTSPGPQALRYPEGSLAKTNTGRPN